MFPCARLPGLSGKFASRRLDPSNGKDLRGGEGIDQCPIVPYAIFKHMYFMEMLKIKLLDHMSP